MSPDFRLLQQAIEEGRNVSATYHQHHRLMTPHTLGWKDGREQCLCYQFDGTSKSRSHFPPNSPSNWRCVRVEDLHDIQLAGGDLKTCDRHTQPQTCVDDVLVELDLYSIAARRRDQGGDDQ